ncbi:hypothetical protein ABC337_12865 [Arthrobacter sp. 1P04PC]
MDQLPERSRPIGGPDEGRYDPRKGAQGYAPIVASFGALAVTALVVVFTSPPAPQDQDHAIQTLTAGLLAIAVFGSFAGSFALAAIAAEDDPTANIPASVMFIAVPVSLAFLGILGSFEALAATFLAPSAKLFALITVAGGAATVFFSAAVVADSWSMHPTRNVDSLINWRKQQWIQNQKEASKAANTLIKVGIAPMMLVFVLRLFDVHWAMNLDGVNVTVGVGIALTLAGTGTALVRVRHPDEGNHQIGLKPWEAWASTAAISLYAFWLALILPLGPT